MTSARCEKCKLITFECFNESSEVKHHNFEALKESARLGCDMCVLLRQYITYEADKNYPPAKSDEIVLYMHAREKKPNLQQTWEALTFEVGEESFWPESAYGQCLNICPQIKSGLSLDWPSISGLLGFAPATLLDDLQRLVKDTIRPWISQCQQAHHLCNIRHNIANLNDLPLLPTRVIDVGSNNRNLRLYIGASEDQNHAQYLALSYCWGNGNLPAKTTQSNIDSRTREIHAEGLPQTILDAIEVTRAVGERFLWVDALCIIQPEDDDREDWMIESPKMCQYYENALCTISAANARSSQEGFLKERPGTKYPARDCLLKQLIDPANPPNSCEYITLKTAAPNWYRNVITAPLYKRGWTLQERSLSRRILHWGDDALFWECLELKASEIAPWGLLEESLPARHDFGFGLLLQMSKEDVLGKWWRSLINVYSDMSLSINSDNLIALKGLVDRIQFLFQDQYLHGLWRSQIISGLIWKPYLQEAPAQAKLIAPSWSWASIARAICFPPYEPDSFRCLAELDSVDGELDILRLPTEKSECRLHISGFMQNYYYSNDLNYGWAFDFAEKKPAIPCNIDCLLMASAKYSHNTHIWYLVLERIDETLPKYRRIGTLMRNVDHSESSLLIARKEVMILV